MWIFIIKSGEKEKSFARWCVQIFNFWKKVLSGCSVGPNHRSEALSFQIFIYSVFPDQIYTTVHCIKAFIPEGLDLPLAEEAS